MGAIEGVSKFHAFYRRLIVKNKILLIDDDPATRESLATSLQSQLYQVFPAATRQEAVIAHGEERVDLLIVCLDCGTEKFCGTDVKWLAELDHRMPVVILTKDSTLGVNAQSAMGDFLNGTPLGFERAAAENWRIN